MTDNKTNRKRVIRRKSKSLIKKTTEITTKKKNTKRILNLDTPTADKTGLNFSVARVKNVLSNYALNMEESRALSELKQAIQKQLTFDDVEDPTKSLVDKAMSDYRLIKTKEYEKKTVSKLSDKKRAKYTRKLKNVKDTENFDLHSFNISIQKGFYDKLEDFINDSFSGKNKWEQSCNLISKLRIRFSFISHIVVTCLIEFVLRKYIANAIKNCVDNKRSIIQVSHTVNSDISEEELKRLYLTLDTWYEGVKFVEDDKESGGRTNYPEAGNSKQFRFYINEVCKFVRKQLSNDEELDSDLRVLYGKTSVSKDFKQHCSNLVTELLVRMGHMMKIEVESRGIKTVSEIVSKTSIRQLFLGLGLSSDNLMQFVDEKTTCYLNFVQNRRAKSKSGELVYETDE